MTNESGSQSITVTDYKQLLKIYERVFVPRASGSLMLKLQYAYLRCFKTVSYLHPANYVKSIIRISQIYFNMQNK